MVGGLYLLGNYDPTLPVAALREMATQLRARGVTRVDGDVRVSDDLYRDTLGTNRVKITVDAPALRPGDNPHRIAPGGSVLVHLTCKGGRGAQVR